MVRVAHALVDRPAGIGSMEDGGSLAMDLRSIRQGLPHRRVSKPSTLLRRICGNEGDVALAVHHQDRGAADRLFRSDTPRTGN